LHYRQHYSHNFHFKQFYALEFLVKQSVAWGCGRCRAEESCPVCQQNTPTQATRQRDAASGSPRREARWGRCLHRAVL